MGNSEKVKIALLGPIPEAAGGIAHFHKQMTLELKRRKDVTLNLLYWNKMYPFDKSVLEKSPKTFLSWMGPVSWCRFFRCLKRQKTDIFMTHWVHPIHAPFLLFVFSLLVIFSKVKIYLIVHNLEQHERFLFGDFLTKLVLKFPNKIISHSKQDAHDLFEMGVDSDRVIFAFHPLYEHFRKFREVGSFNVGVFKKELALRKKVLLFFGYIRPYKGLECLLEAFRDVVLSDKNYSLLIVGESFWKKHSILGKSMFFTFLKRIFIGRGADNYDPLKLIERYKLQNHCVVINRYVPDSEVFKYFSTCDVLVAPYVTASQSGPVGIAYVFDKPVIVSKTGGLKDVVLEGKTGYFFEVGNADDLKMKILQFFNKKQISRAAISEFKRNFTWERYMDLIFANIN